jgi:hypothetical protein
VRLLAAVVLAAATRAQALTLSSSTLSDPHQLVGAALTGAPDVKPLQVFPERLVYNVSWGVMSVGDATLETTELLEFGGRPAYHIVSRAVSNKFCDAFYKVRDLNESWIDAAKFSSLGYQKNLHEGHFVRDEWVVYDTDKHDFLAKITGKDGHFEYKAGTVPVSVQDILSSMYYLRSQKLAEGNEITLDVNTKQNWPLVIRVIKKEKVRTPAGAFNTILVEPALRQEGIFIQKGRKLQIWLTDDDRKMPVQMKVEVFFGHVTAKLAKVL